MQQLLKVVGDIYRLLLVVPCCGGPTTRVQELAPLHPK
jgi:hypothetical protein